jgi:undecaprenyl diphosphate synthase
MKGELTEEDIRRHLDHPEIPDPDLIIRTGQECRISNFLIWQGAYSELYFSSKMWPDWYESDLKEALDSYGCRDRRYGAQGSAGSHAPESPALTAGIR